ncbi:mitogen-activated protein kinase kinase kinase 3-like isoform X1 [Triticum urartu]|uniref:mitogen-activated protein kinase kinase kinase 3-like isoform X1 n=1 Tax=Triticum urartu TaxID=4572 RepID=UPI002044B354|nr:mitogen-activated protein kinase kinase kinase 3-like isoform X1 [Triticum urartu]
MRLIKMNKEVTVKEEELDAAEDVDVVTYVQTSRFVTSMAACPTISTACIQLFQNSADQPRFMFPFQGRSNIITIHRLQMLPLLSVCLISLFFITEFGCRRTKRSTHQEVMLFPTTTAKAHIRELEEEVKLLKNLSHPNIKRYLGTVREEDTLNILLEFVPGGSIQSLLGKLGSFPEAVIRKYTRQILQGLEYLHSNAIIHRDIKGANILVDNKGCIKLADFGASKQVAKLVRLMFNMLLRSSIIAWKK